MLLERYLAKEVLTTLLALISILLFAFMSNQLMLFLARAASGKLPFTLVFELVLLMAPRLLGLLLPIALFFSILLAYGRLYADSEMTVLSACGLSHKRLLAITFSIACLVAVVVAYFVLELGPRFSEKYYQLSKDTSTAVLADALLPGSFQKIGHQGTVVYVQEKSDNKMQKIFIARKNPKPSRHSGADAWQILSAKQGSIVDDAKTGASYFVAEDGGLAQVAASKQNIQTSQFKQLGIHLTQQAPPKITKAKALPTSELWPINNPKLDRAAELQWRLSFPILTLIFALMAVPLSRINPRQGKFAKLIPGTVFIISYANLLIVVRKWVSAGTIPVTIGMWWLHILALLLTIFVIAYPTLKRKGSAGL